MTVALGGHPKGTGKKPLGSSSILLPGKADCPHPAEPAPENPECEVTPTASPSPPQSPVHVPPRISEKAPRGLKGRQSGSPRLPSPGLAWGCRPRD